MRYWSFLRSYVINRVRRTQLSDCARGDYIPIYHQANKTLFFFCLFSASCGDAIAQVMRQMKVI